MSSVDNFLDKLMELEDRLREKNDLILYYNSKIGYFEIEKYEAALRLTLDKVELAKMKHIVIDSVDTKPMLKQLSEMKKNYDLSIRILEQEELPEEVVKNLILEFKERAKSYYPLLSKQSSEEFDKICLAYQNGDLNELKSFPIKEDILSTCDELMITKEIELIDKKIININKEFPFNVEKNILDEELRKKWISSIQDETNRFKEEARLIEDELEVLKPVEGLAC